MRLEIRIEIDEIQADFSDFLRKSSVTCLEGKCNFPSKFAH